MKKIIAITFIAFLLIGNMAIAQITDWFWLNPYPQGNDLYSIDMVDSNIAIAVGAQGTIIKTTDGGRSWRVTYNVSGLDSNLTRVVMANEKRGYVLGDSIVLRTENGGLTWERIPNPYNLNLNAISFINPNYCIASSKSGEIIKSTDGGYLWDHVNEPIGNIYDLRGINDSIWIVVGDSNIYRTSDIGLSWVSQSSYPKVNHRNIHFLNNDTGIVVNRDYIYRTSNSGIEWIPWHDQGYFYIYSHGAILLNDSLGIGIGDLRDPWPHNGLIKSTDGGKSWFFDVDYGSFWYTGWQGTSISEQKQRWIAVGEQGIIILSDGLLTKAWGEFTGIAFPRPFLGFSTSRSTYKGWYGDVFYTTDGGQRWSKNESYSSRVKTFISSTNDGNILIGDACFETMGVDSLIGYSLPVSECWSSFNAYFTTKNKGWVWGYYGFYKTSDGGISWNSDTIIFNVMNFSDSVHGIKAGNNGSISISTDGGDTWIDKRDTSTISFTYAKIFDANKAMVAGGNVILRTMDGGNHWERITTFRIGEFIDLNTGVSLENNKVYYTLDGGYSWTETTVPTKSALNDIEIVQNPVIGAVIAQRQTENMSKKNQRVTFDAAVDPTIYVVGNGGAILVAGLSPLRLRTWNGSMDNSWFTSENWTPNGIPIPGDSVIIPGGVPHNPVINKKQQQIVIASLGIGSGGKLTITDSLSRFTVMSDVRIGGTLEITPGARTSIFAGRNWIIEETADSGFVPAQSTVYLIGEGTFEQKFYNLVLDTLSNMTSAGNVNVESRCWVLNDANLGVNDTLFIADSTSDAVLGSGKIIGGTIARSIQPGTTSLYRYESDSTYIQFSGSGTYASAVKITTYPNQDPLSLYKFWTFVGGEVDTASKTLKITTTLKKSKWAIGVPRLKSGTKKVMSDQSDIQRLYSIDPVGNTDSLVTISLRYDTSEIPAGTPEQDLQLMISIDTMSLSSSITPGWNIISIPVEVTDGRKTALFPSAISDAITYEGGGIYVDKDTLVNGKGYWLKFDQSDTVIIAGSPISVDSVDVLEGWNLIGSVTTPVSVNLITSEPSGITTSNFFEYGGNYNVVNSIEPGHGYWVKVNQDGKLMLQSDEYIGSKNRIKIVPSDELPPAPPINDNTTKEVPTSYSLEQNIPNPFNPVTTIKYQLPYESRVVLRVYNTLGQIVITLIDQVESACYKSVELICPRLASGVYFYRLEATSISNPGRSFTQVKKMILLK